MKDTRSLTGSISESIITLSKKLSTRFRFNNIENISAPDYFDTVLNEYSDLKIYNANLELENNLIQFHCHRPNELEKNIYLYTLEYVHTYPNNLTNILMLYKDKLIQIPSYIITKLDTLIYPILTAKKELLPEKFIQLSDKDIQFCVNESQECYVQIPQSLCSVIDIPIEQICKRYNYIDTNTTQLICTLLTIYFEKFYQQLYHKHLDLAGKTIFYYHSSSFNASFKSAFRILQSEKFVEEYQKEHIDYFVGTILHSSTNSSWIEYAIYDKSYLDICVQKYLENSENILNFTGNSVSLKTSGFIVNSHHQINLFKSLYTNKDGKFGDIITGKDYNQ